MMLPPGKSALSTSITLISNVANNNNSDISTQLAALAKSESHANADACTDFFVVWKIDFRQHAILRQVELSGPVNARISTDLNGNYEFVNLPAGEYTVTPINGAFDFEPTEPHGDDY